MPLNFWRDFRCRLFGRVIGCTRGGVTPAMGEGSFVARCTAAIVVCVTACVLLMRALDSPRMVGTRSEQTAARGYPYAVVATDAEVCSQIGVGLLKQGGEWTSKLPFPLQADLTDDKHPRQGVPLTHRSPRRSASVL